MYIPYTGYENRYTEYKYTYTRYIRDTCIYTEYKCNNEDILFLLVSPEPILL